MQASEIDAALAGRLVAQQFPDWSHLPVEQVLPGGHDNRTFRLGDGRSVRLPSAACYAAHVAVEHEWLPRLRSQLSVAIPEVPIPEILGEGRPSETFPWPWTVLRWIRGRSLDASDEVDLVRLAEDLAAFLHALSSLPSAGGPAPGDHNFHRGGDLSVYDGEARDGIARLPSLELRRSATNLWQSALDAKDPGAHSWVHGDVSAGNLLIDEGRLAAVVDFGQLAVGDPACDYVACWTLFSGASRETFRRSLGVDEAVWARARGWALWKELLIPRDRPSPLLVDLLDDEEAPTRGAPQRPPAG